MPSPEIMGIFSEVNPAACDNTTTKAAVKRIRSRYIDVNFSYIISIKNNDTHKSPIGIKKDHPINGTLLTIKALKDFNKTSAKIK